MAITFLKKPKAPEPAPPVESPPLLAALKQSTTSKQTLMLVHNKTGVGYKVVSHDLATGKTRLKNEHGALLNVKITERECEFYTPVFR